MIKTINFTDFCDAFRSHERQDQFSYEAKRALFEYLEEQENEDTPIELDVIALCCEFTEYKDMAELKEAYSNIESMPQ